MLLGSKVGAGRTVDAYVIGEGDGVIAKFGGTTNQLFRMADTAQEGETGTGVEFGKNGNV